MFKIGGTGIAVAIPATVGAASRIPLTARARAEELSESIHGLRRPVHTHWAGHHFRRCPRRLFHLQVHARPRSPTDRHRSRHNESARTQPLLVLTVVLERRVVRLHPVESHSSPQLNVLHAVVENTNHLGRIAAAEAAEVTDREGVTGSASRNAVLGVALRIFGEHFCAAVSQWTRYDPVGAKRGMAGNCGDRHHLTATHVVT